MFIVEWWNSLGIAGQVFACIAIPATVILLIQTVMMFIGLGDDSDIDIEAGGDTDLGDIPDTDTSGDGVFGEELPEDVNVGEGLGELKFFTLRGIIAFFVVFGWVGLAMCSGDAKLYVTIPVAIICGGIMMLFIALLIRGVMKLRTNGNTDNRNAVGASGKVQLTVPAQRCGAGKVHVMLQGAYVERDAVTDDEAPIPTGSEIIVIGVSGQTTLVVRKK